MRGWALVFLCCLMPLAVHAGRDKRVTHNYDDVSIAEALRQLGKECKGRYVINFMYDELEDFRVTARVKKQTIPDAIHQMIGHYPISMTIEGDSAIYVECFLRHSARLKGIVVDEHGAPLEFANVTLLSPVDSSMVAGGVTTVSGRFVIPYEPQPAIVRVTYVGYKPSYRRCETDNAGTIKMELENFTLNNVTVTDDQPLNAKKLKKNRRQREHVLITLNDSTVVDGYLVSDIKGDKLRLYRNGLNPRVIRLKDVRSVKFVSEGDTAAVEYIPVRVIDEISGDKRAKLRLLTMVYDSDYVSGYTSPATDYYTYETQYYSGPTKANPAGSWHTQVHVVPFNTREYYYQVKGNAVAMPYWLLSWSPSKNSMAYHFKKIFKHFPGIISTVNDPEFDCKTFFERPETLMPVLDAALQQGDYQAVIVGEEKHAKRAEVMRTVFDTLETIGFMAAGIIVLLKI